MNPLADVMRMSIIRIFIEFIRNQTRIFLNVFLFLSFYTF